MQGRVNEDTGRLGERREGELCFPDFNVGKVEMTLGGEALALLVVAELRPARRHVVAPLVLRLHQHAPRAVAIVGRLVHRDGARPRVIQPGLACLGQHIAGIAVHALLVLVVGLRLVDVVLAKARACAVGAGALGIRLTPLDGCDRRFPSVEDQVVALGAGRAALGEEYRVAQGG